MLIIAAITGSLVMHSTDLCAEPFAGGVGEPDFCVIAESTTVDTPYFSFDVAPKALVGIDRNGARAIVQGSIRQSQVHLVIEAHPRNDQDKLMDRMGRCGDLVLETESVLVCDWSTDGVVRVVRLSMGKNRLVLSELSAAGTGLEFLPDYKTMLESVVPE